MSTSGIRMKKTTMAASPPRKLRRKVFITGDLRRRPTVRAASNALAESLAANPLPEDMYGGHAGNQRKPGVLGGCGVPGCLVR